MADIKVYLDKFSESGGRVFARALQQARDCAQNCVMVEHLTAALAEVEAASFDVVLKELNVERAAFQAVLAQRIATGPRYAGQGIRLAPETIEVCKLALRRAESYARKRIEPVDLLIGLTLNRPVNLYSILGPLGVTPSALVKVVLDFETAVEVARVIVPAGARLINKQVRIKSGPFASFTGYIANVSQDDRQLEVVVAIFGHRKFVTLSPQDVEIIDFKK
jgi:ATP-dependent Clp protease ATP-binding subunit ClpA